MFELKNTTQIIEAANYYDSAASFFANFRNAWSEVKGQVVKMETKQFYDEGENESINLYLAGKIIEAVKLIPEFRDVDAPLYKDLTCKRIDFFRCRPVEFPLSVYLKWELECYVYNAINCEKIYLHDYNKNLHMYDNYIFHDFMVFDDKIAFVHNYDTHGRIVGGWKVLDPSDIINLTCLFFIAKSVSINFKSYLCNINYDLMYPLLMKK